MASMGSDCSLVSVTRVDSPKARFQDNIPFENTVTKASAGGDIDDKIPVTQANSSPEPKPVGLLEIFRFADKWDVLLLSIGTICAIITGAALPVQMMILGDMTTAYLDLEKMVFFNNTPPNMIGTISTTETTLYDSDPTSIRSYVKSFTYQYIAMGFGVLLSAYGMIAFWYWSSVRQVHHMRVEYFKAILRQDVGWYDMNSPGELVSRLAGDLQKIQNGMGDKAAMFLQGIACFATGFLIGFVRGWELTLVISTVAPGIIISAALLVKFSSDFSREESRCYAKAGAIAEEFLSSIRTVVAFGAEDKVADKYVVNLSLAKKVGIKKGLTFGLGMGISWAFCRIAYALSFWYGAKLIREGALNGEGLPLYNTGTIFVVLFSIMAGAFALGNVAPTIQDFSTARGAAAAVFQVIDRVPKINSEETGGTNPKTVHGKIEFRNISFNYPSRKHIPILQNFSITVSPGETVALVGTSGCGKSTAIQLLQRFYDPDNGEVLIDGQNIRKWDASFLRSQIGVVLQEPTLFSTSIAENIRYGRIDVTEDQIVEAAIKANAHDFISLLPQKYETLVGERGLHLSGGQKQRIAVARALVRDPRILLLDEATSALDVHSERVVQEALDNAGTGRTTLIVAHRLSTIRHADRIFVVDKGSVVESGKHEQLMETAGIYYKLVMSQTKFDEVEVAEANGPDATETSVPDEEFTEISLDSKHHLRKNSSKYSRTLSSRSLSRPEEDAIAIIEIESPETSNAGVGRLLKINSKEWIYISAGCLGSILNGLVEPAVSIIVTSMIRIFSDGNKQNQEADAFLFSMLCLGLAAMNFFSWFLQIFMFAVSGEYLTRRIRDLTFRAMLRQEIGWFDKQENNTGSLTTRLATDASSVQSATGVRIGVMLQMLTLIIGGLVVSFYYSWKLALVTLTCVPFVIAGGFFEKRILETQTKNNMKAMEATGKIATEAVMNFKTVVALGLQSKFVKEYEKCLMVPYKNELKKAHLHGAVFSLSQAIYYFAYAIGFTYAAYLIEQKEITFAAAFQVFDVLIFCSLALGQATSYGPEYTKAKIAAGRIFTILDRKSEIDARKKGQVPDNFTGKVEFRDIKFSFPTRKEAQVLRGFDLTIGAKQCVALVGPSGCGKSTTVQLVEQFYEPLGGDILIDGIPLRDLDLKWVRASIGLVAQEPTLFTGTVKENISFGCSSSVTVEEIIAASKDANIHDFIMNLPQQYDTFLGERGAQLSGGQKQRIAIARALIRNPKILLLDEATSALDTESEAIVQEALDRAQKQRTCIVIAHRINTVQSADQIAVISHGKVRELGAHGPLLMQDGLYSKLVSAYAGR